MAEPTKREAVGLLWRLRKLADAQRRVRRPNLRSVRRRPRGMGLLEWMQWEPASVAAHALADAGYYGASGRAQWIAAIDRAIRTLEASDG